MSESILPLVGIGLFPELGPVIASLCCLVSRCRAGRHILMGQFQTGLLVSGVMSCNAI